ncbi:hypothetical protein NDU88_003274 [Pleurodeles waltl]|uniref:Uncharacterized protein n=1 Tax=Pleurodeles waltl TaxID=8319 RepID=A0AAV7LIE0_PLEWA|nr:hypothetical protein NDU88_003274 [Pleurodeles waltl]
MSRLPRVPRSDSQHQIAARADTFIYSARAASHLEATMSRRPVTAHAVAKPAQVPFYPRRPPVPQAFESLACSAVLGGGMSLPCCRPSGFRSLSPCSSALISGPRVLSSRSQAASNHGLGSGHSPCRRTQRGRVIQGGGASELPCPPVNRTLPLQPVLEPVPIEKWRGDAAETSGG